MTNFPLLKIYDGFTLILQLTNEIYMIFINEKRIFNANGIWDTGPAQKKPCPRNLLFWKVFWLIVTGDLCLGVERKMSEEIPLWQRTLKKLRTLKNFFKVR